MASEIGALLQVVHGGHHADLRMTGLGFSIYRAFISSIAVALTHHTFIHITNQHGLNQKQNKLGPSVLRVMPRCFGGTFTRLKRHDRKHGDVRNQAPKQAICFSLASPIYTHSPLVFVASPCHEKTQKHPSNSAAYTNNKGHFAINKHRQKTARRPSCSCEIKTLQTLCSLTSQVVYSAQDRWC